jgi:hypothetical protein
VSEKTEPDVGRSGDYRVAVSHAKGVRTGRDLPNMCLMASAIETVPELNMSGIECQVEPTMRKSSPIPEDDSRLIGVLGAQTIGASGQRDETGRKAIGRR